MQDYAKLQREHGKCQKIINRIKLEKNTLLDCYHQNADKIKKVEQVLYESFMEEYKIVSEDLTAIRHDMKMKFESQTAENIKEEELNENKKQEVILQQQSELGAKDI